MDQGDEMCVKTHTHYAIHNHAHRIFDRSPPLEILHKSLKFKNPFFCHDYSPQTFLKLI